MKRTGKVVKIALLALLAVMLLVIGVTFIIHRIKTGKEQDLLKEKGYYNPVSVGDYSLNVAKFGKENGGHTIVAMSGLGMGDFPITARQMTSALEEDNLVVFIDRAGYGLSDDTGNDMTIEYIVEDYRKALKNAGLTAPYILMPHSMGGVYANYWSGMYPEEVEAVVFVDGTPLSDAVFENNSEDSVGFEDRILSFLSNLGFVRYQLRDIQDLLPDNYTEADQDMADALQLRTECTIALASECCFHDKNLQTAWKELKKSDIPKLYICASWGYKTKEEFEEYLKWYVTLGEKNGRDMQTLLSEATDEKIQQQLNEYEKLRNDIIYPYAEKMGNCEVALLPGNHAIYEQKPEECGTLIIDFINGLDK